MLCPDCRRTAKVNKVAVAGAPVPSAPMAVVAGVLSDDPGSTSLHTGHSGSSPRGAGGRVDRPLEVTRGPSAMFLLAALVVAPPAPDAGVAVSRSRAPSNARTAASCWRARCDRHAGRRRAVPGGGRVPAGFPGRTRPGCRPRSCERVGRGAIVFEAAAEAESPGRPRQAYSLVVDAGGVRIRAGTAAGAFWAVQTLRQLLPRGRRTQIRRGDAPRAGGPHRRRPPHAWRGSLVDVGRPTCPRRSSSATSICWRSTR